MFIPRRKGMCWRFYINLGIRSNYNIRVGAILNLQGDFVR